MSLRNEAHPLAHEQHKVPVTALEFYSDHLLLAGEGKYLVAYNTDRKSQLGSTRIFRSQAIHRILVNRDSQDILICGGSHVAFARLQSDGDGVVTFAILAHTDAGDWIFNAAFSPPSEHDSETTVVLVTAHNALMRCTLQRSHHISGTSSILMRTLVPGSNCILYCAHTFWLDGTRCLVASGTAFGDIILWSCHFDLEKQQVTNVMTHYIFQAHEGSVFDVQISESLQQGTLGGTHRVLASCSDDRTIRLWDISDLNCESPSMTDIQRQTGLGSIDQSNIYAPPLLSKASGHISRVWMVRFLWDQKGTEDHESETRNSPPAVASFGEDGSCITWKVETVTDRNDHSTHVLRQTRVLPIHAGKNIWSATIHNGRGATGGADGLIVLLPSIAKSSQALGITDNLQDPLSDETRLEHKETFQSYSFVSNDTVVATTTLWHIVTLTLGEDGASSIERHGSYESLSKFSMTSSCPGLVFVAGIRGQVLMFSSLSKACFPLAELSGKAAGLFLSEPSTATTSGKAKETNLLITTVGSTAAKLVNIVKTDDNTDEENHNIAQQELILPPRSIATSFLLIEFDDARYAIVGLRNGSLVIYDLSGTTSKEPLSHIRVLQRCHGKDSVTAMRFKPAVDNMDAGYVFSTGRDGTCAVHRVTTHETSISFELFHQLELPFGPNIEGLCFTEDNSLRIWGFKGKHFVVHDLNLQQDVFTVECGGGVHRNWAYEPSENGGTFVWTQNSTLMRVSQSELPLQTIRAGAHGREIKAVAVSHGPHKIIATGAEDTDIKLSTYSYRAGFTCLQTLRKHNTGIQHLQWSADGSRLFSSAGSEEFYVWRICHDIPVLGVGVICESIHPRTTASDLRITSFDVRESESHLIIAMAYSDSTTKIWSYTPATGAWTSRSSGSYLTSSLTSIHHFSQSDTHLLTTATDGHTALWQTQPETLSWQTRHKAHQNATLSSILATLSDASTLVVTAGDDGAIAFSRLLPDGTMATLLLPRAHAAAVTGLIVQRIEKDVLCVVSAGVDQKVKVWHARVDVEGRGVDGMSVRRAGSVSTSVADVSSLEILRFEDGGRGVVVCGVGVDVWRIAGLEETEDE
jgi:WD40 repeat protein